MKCPHCFVQFHEIKHVFILGEDIDGRWGLEMCKCPACEKNSFFLINGNIKYDSLGRAYIEEYEDGREIINSRELVRPRATFRPPVPKEVPAKIANDYSEACLVLADSPKASAALSRRCLQNLLRSSANIKNDDLAKEIEEVLKSNQLPTHLADSIDAIRNIGNYAAHPMKSKSTGEILEVEQGEAEWNLEVLEMLFDFYYVQPEKARQRKEALNQKLIDAGKPKMK